MWHHWWLCPSNFLYSTKNFFSLTCYQPLMGSTVFAYFEIETWMEKFKSSTVSAKRKSKRHQTSKTSLQKRENCLHSNSWKNTVKYASAVKSQISFISVPWLCVHVLVSACRVLYPVGTILVLHVCVLYCSGLCSYQISTDQHVHTKIEGRLEIQVVCVFSAERCWPCSGCRSDFSRSVWIWTRGFWWRVRNGRGLPASAGQTCVLFLYIG